MNTESVTPEVVEDRRTVLHKMVEVIPEVLIDAYSVTLRRNTCVVQTDETVGIVRQLNSLGVILTICPINRYLIGTTSIYGVKVDITLT